MKDIVRYIFIIPLLMLVACSTNDEVMPDNEMVTVRFATDLPSLLDTRGVINGTEVDCVVCTIFPLKNGVAGNELTELRSTIEVTEENKNNIVYAPILALDHEYRVVFYAMKQGAYNVANMNEITRVDGLSSTHYDAFTRTIDFTVTPHATHTVYLIRPLAKLNLGTTQADYDAIIAKGMHPTYIQLTVDKNYNTYNAVTGATTGNAATYTYSMPVGTTTLTVDEETYIHFAESYILVGEENNIALTYTIYGKRLEAGVPIGEETIICTRTIEDVLLQKNFNTNIVGNLMTGFTTNSII